MQNKIVNAPSELMDPLIPTFKKLHITSTTFETYSTRDDEESVQEVEYTTEGIFFKSRTSSMVNLFDDIYKDKLVNIIHHDGKDITFSRNRTSGNLCYYIIEYDNPIYESCYAMPRLCYLTNGYKYCTVNYMGKIPEDRRLLSFDQLLKEFDILFMGVNAIDLCMKNSRVRYKIYRDRNNKYNKDSVLVKLSNDNRFIEKLECFLQSYGEWKVTTIGLRRFMNKVCKYRVSKYYFKV